MRNLTLFLGCLSLIILVHFGLGEEVKKRQASYSCGLCSQENSLHDCYQPLLPNLNVSGLFPPPPNMTAMCVICPIGTFSDASDVNCSGDGTCSPGSCFSSEFCAKCPAGHFADTCNTSSCKPCQPGWRSADDIGSSGCIMCPAGTYTSNGSNCFGCPEGTYSTNGSSECVSCGAGYYNPEQNSTSQEACKPCPAKYYCPYPKTSSPMPCPKNSYCKGNAESVPCPILFQSRAKSSSCKPSIMLYILAGGCAFLVIVIVVVIWIKVSSVRRAKTERKKDKEKEVLIPPPLPGPVYDGY